MEGILLFGKTNQPRISKQKLLVVQPRDSIIRLQVRDPFLKKYAVEIVFVGPKFQTVSSKVQLKEVQSIAQGAKKVRGIIRRIQLKCTRNTELLRGQGAETQALN